VALLRDFDSENIEHDPETYPGFSIVADSRAKILTYGSLVLGVVFRKAGGCK